MDDKILYEVTTFKIMKRIRTKVNKKFLNWYKWKPRIKKNTRGKLKELNDLIVNVLFFKDEDKKFFPDMNNKDVIDVLKNKLRYSVDDQYKKDNFKSEIKDIKNIFNSNIKMFDSTYALMKKQIKDFTINIKKKGNKITFLTKFPMNGQKVECTNKIYNKLQSTIKKKIPKTDYNKIIFITLLRYNINLKSNNHQLGIIYNKKYRSYDVELFASPFNRTLKKFCSFYRDIDKLYSGNQGSFFRYKLKSNKKYTMNPPYIEKTMTKAVKKLINDLNDVTNVEIIITIPIWDYDSLIKMREDLIANKMDSSLLDFVQDENMENWEAYEPYEMLKKYKYTKSITKKYIKEHTYIDHLNNSKISVTNTFEIIIEKP